MTMKLGKPESRMMQTPGKRDAFHVPVVLVQGDGTISPGDNIRFVDDDYKQVVECASDHRHAIADPFLETRPSPGELFWALLIPNSVKNLVHHFEIDIDTSPPEEDCGCFDGDDGCPRGCS